MNFLYTVIAWITRKHVGVAKVDRVIARVKSQVAELEAGAKHIVESVDAHRADIVAEEQKVAEFVAERTAKITELSTKRAEAEAFAKWLKQPLG